MSEKDFLELMDKLTEKLKSIRTNSIHNYSGALSDDIVSTLDIIKIAKDKFKKPAKKKPAKVVLDGLESLG